MLTAESEKKYAANARYTNFYGGHDIYWSENGQYIYCLNGDIVNKVDIETSQIVGMYGANVCNNNELNNAERTKIFEAKDEDNIYCFAISHEHLVAAHVSGLLRLWELGTQKVVKLWKSQHKGPVVQIEFSPSGTIICTSGGADASLRLWDFANNICLCVLKDFPGPALMVKFNPHPLKSEIYAVGADNIVYCWNYIRKALVDKLSGHIAKVTDISFKFAMADYNQLATVGRDKVLISWRQQCNEVESKWIQEKVIPLYEELVGVRHIGDGGQLVIACCSGRLLHIDTNSWKISDLSKTKFEISRLLYCKTKEQLALITTEQNIILYNVSVENKLAEVKLYKQLVGYNDEILDMCFLGDNDRYLAIATNSKHMKLYDRQNNMNCCLISGHSDTVMALAASRNLLISVGKDCSIHLWKLSHEIDCFLQPLTQQNKCHIAAIGCVTITHNGAKSFASACQDGSMKVWQLCRDKQDRKKYSFSLKYSVLAHDKEVNGIMYAPNNKILATASQDKTAKLWAADSNVLLGVLRGHTRGVWCVRFSPVDQIVLTSSSDCTMRLWSIKNFSCLKRLEQESTILRVEFLDHGKFILSASSDGLLKLWNIKNSICVQSIDEHNDRVWSVAVSACSNRFFFTGGADSKLIHFADISETARNKTLDRRQQILEQEQILLSLLHSKQQLGKAFMLALLLDKPKTSFDVLCHFAQRRDVGAMNQLMDQLDIDQRLVLFHHIKAWINNSRHSYVVNIVLKSLLGEIMLNTTQNLFNKGNLVEVLTPYVFRHYRRVTELSRDVSFLEFIVKGL